MQIDRTAIVRLAARTFLKLVSSHAEPILVARTHDFLSDRGAIGWLVNQHAEGQPWSAICLGYWNSRLERNAARLEDLVTAMFIAVLSGVVSGVVLEFIKANAPFLAKPNIIVLTSDDLADLVQSGTASRTELEAIYRAFKNKDRDSSEEGGPPQAETLYAHVSNGEGLDSYATQNLTVNDSGLPKQFEFAHDVAKGVVQTEFGRIDGKYDISFERRISGLPFSPHAAFGEVISLLPLSWPEIEDAAALRVVHEVRATIRAHRLYPELWPRNISTAVPSPKILILSNRVCDLYREVGFETLAQLSSGIICVDGGMTSHVAILSRGIGIPAIGVDLQAAEAGRAKFAYFDDGVGSIYFDRPGITEANFSALLSATKRPVEF